MPTGWYGTICAYCFNELKDEELFVDENGVTWDCCKGECAEKLLGLPEKDEENGTQSEDA